jgi:hypothetical protein
MRASCITCPACSNNIPDTKGTVYYRSKGVSECGLSPSVVEVPNRSSGIGGTGSGRGTEGSGVRRPTGADRMYPKRKNR